jgi:hypothetical protein
LNESLVSHENNYGIEDKTLAADRFAHDRPSQNLFTTNVGHNDYPRGDVGRTRGKERGSNPVSGRDSGVGRDSDSRRDRERFNEKGGRESSKDIEEQLTKLKKTFATLVRDK